MEWTRKGQKELFAVFDNKWTLTVKKQAVYFSPLINCAVYEALQLVLEIFLSRVLTGLSTWKRHKM